PGPGRAGGEQSGPGPRPPDLRPGTLQPDALRCHDDDCRFGAVAIRPGGRNRVTHRVASAAQRHFSRLTGLRLRPGRNSCGKVGLVRRKWFVAEKLIRAAEGGHTSACNKEMCPGSPHRLEATLTRPAPSLRDILSQTDFAP